LESSVAADRTPRHRLADARAAVGRRYPWLRSARGRGTAMVRSSLQRLGSLRRSAVGRPAGGLPDHPADPDLGYLIVVGYGRSGSTLLQGILNSIPGYLIRGENGAALYHLHRYQSGLETEQVRNSRLKALDARNSWYGIDGFTPDRSVIDLRRTVLQSLLRPEPGARVVGFKEIRWWQDDWESYLDFLQRLLPGVRFVLNTRDLRQVAQSRWWAEHDDALATLTDHADRLTRIGSRLGDAAYHVHYDDYVDDPDSLRGLYDWLGEPFERARVDAVMSRRHSY
jgi:hypothetical protein